MSITVVVGLQWGDEGKGKIVDYLSQNFDIVARWNGGANAGHTTWLNGKKYVTHLLPSGLLQGKVCVLGCGMVIDPAKLLEEIKGFADQNIDVSPERIMISSSANIVLPTHKALDKAKEKVRGKNAIGTTGQGISPAYQDKEQGRGVQAGLMKVPLEFGKEVRELVRQHNRELVALGCADLQTDPFDISYPYQVLAEQLGQYIKDTPAYLQQSLKAEKNVLAEGAQGALLDKTYGTVPYVTRSSTIASSAPYGLGVDPDYVTKVIGIAKCFQTRVGEGPMPTEIFDDKFAKHLRSEGKPGEEKGATTGRTRRVGWLDMPLLHYAVGLNRINELILTKLDVLSGLDFVKVCESYRYRHEEVVHLPAGVISNLKDCTPVYKEWNGWSAGEIVYDPERKEICDASGSYVQRIERQVGVPVSLVSVGVDRNDVLRRKI